MYSEGLIKHRLQVMCKVVINQILERVNKEAAVLCEARGGAEGGAGAESVFYCDEGCFVFSSHECRNTQHCARQIWSWSCGIFKRMVSI